jgi:competence protein ComEA
MSTSRWIKGTLISLALCVAPAFGADAVNVNTADAQTIAQRLDGIGPAKAQAIVDYRQSNGPFKTVDDLEKVKGIGKSTLEKIRERVSVEGGALPAKTGSAPPPVSKAGG